MSWQCWKEELRHLEFKCRNILRAQKMQQLRTLHEGLAAGGGEPVRPGGWRAKKHELSLTSSELPEKSDKDSTSAYNTGARAAAAPHYWRAPCLRAPCGGQPRWWATPQRLNRTPSGALGVTQPKAAAPLPGEPRQVRSLSRDPDVGGQHSARRVRHGPKAGVALERGP